MGSNDSFSLATNAVTGQPARVPRTLSSLWRDYGAFITASDVFPPSFPPSSSQSSFFGQYLRVAGPMVLAIGSLFGIWLAIFAVLEDLPDSILPTYELTQPLQPHFRRVSTSLPGCTPPPIFGIIPEPSLLLPAVQADLENNIRLDASEPPCLMDLDNDSPRLAWRMEADLGLLSFVADQDNQEIQWNSDLRD